MVLEYIVCANPRSGSSLLCSTLASVPGAGAPREVFFRGSVHVNLTAWGGAAPGSTRQQPKPSAGFDYLRHARQFAVQNGARAAKVHWDQVSWCRERLGIDPFELFERRGPELMHIYVWRDDMVAQAVSAMIAEATRIYHRRTSEPTVDIENSAGPASKPPEYEFSFLVNYLGVIQEDEKSWRRYFDERGIAPYLVRYEDLAADPAGAATEALAYLRVRHTVVPNSDLEVLRTSLNKEFAERFRTELVGSGIAAGLPPEVRKRCGLR
ncbi:Stf0 family sulfotransferase [Plantactinospora soyae]|uniref:LPS sulfotransferase NodH n=1 Tax=Plantactinospora soyae TaxID=1544732 RepID=A0A927R199_9ACTN|nr:Stf0 family sulfotransferase [Plantactinospora soyae]MBE1489493.1 LPS sulfotransferase NodH [Plantactinospora soyae]